MLTNLNQPKGSTIGVLKDGRTVQQAFDQAVYVPIEQFGAKGDGISDDTAAVQLALSSGKNLTGSSTPSAKFVKVITLGDATTITDLLDGEMGQTVVIRAAANGTTVTHNTNAIRLNGSVDFVMQAGDTLTLAKFFQNQWDEVSRMTRAVVTS